jgi:hypothetical protein
MTIDTERTRQDHYNKIAIKAVKSNLKPIDESQAKRAAHRLQDGEVEPLVINGVQIVLEL